MKRAFLTGLFACSLVFAFSGCIGMNAVPPTKDMYRSSLSLLPVKPDYTIDELMKMEEEETGSYLLGPGDTITVSVYDEEGLTRTVKIEPNGKFTFPLIGEVLAKGKRVSELSQDLDAKLDKFVKNAKTDIVINEFAKNQFIILGGGIANPGAYIITGEIRLLEAIAMAGSIRSIPINEIEFPGADLQHAYISRGGKILPVDFPALINQGDMRYNIRVRPGDVINIPLATANEVCVLGQVGNTSVLPLFGNMTLIKAITMAGGITSSGHARNILVIRKSLPTPKVYTLDFYAILNGEADDFPLEPNDIIFVPERAL